LPINPPEAGVIARHAPRPEVTIVVTVAAAVGVYVWVMGLLLQAFGSWIAAGGGALLRYAGFR
jgi:uncharacterized membrane protein YdbT with pleckstrin-like domain